MILDFPSSDNMNMGHYLLQYS